VQQPAEFYDPRLARLYDAFGRGRADLPFYVALAGEKPKRVLDLCCGTGELATDLAARGHVVTAVDAAAPMLAIAASRPGGDQVTWIEADVRNLALAERFDLVVLSGHAFQAFLSAADVHALLTTARNALAPGGRLAFEMRNPLVREWERWTATAFRGRLVSDDEEFEVRARLLEVRDDLVDFELDYFFAQGRDRLTSRQVLRFPTRERVLAELAAAGFVIEQCYGDWDCSPFVRSSPEIILVAR
jgi:SAM-dependent methyltransferase